MNTILIALLCSSVYISNIYGASWCESQDGDTPAECEANIDFIQAPCGCSCPDTINTGTCDPSGGDGLCTITLTCPSPCSGSSSSDSSDSSSSDSSSNPCSGSSSSDSDSEEPISLAALAVLNNKGMGNDMINNNDNNEENGNKHIVLSVSDYTFYNLWGLCGLVIFINVFILCICWCRNKRNKREKIKYIDNDESRIDIMT